LHDATIAIEQLERMDRAAAGRVGKSDSRRIGPAPRPIIARDRPKVAPLDAAAAGIEHWRFRLGDRDLAGGKNEFAAARWNLSVRLTGSFPAFTSHNALESLAISQ
jgi:hypothetical protein